MLHQLSIRNPAAGPAFGFRADNGASVAAPVRPLTFTIVTYTGFRRGNALGLLSKPSFSGNFYTAIHKSLLAPPRGRSCRPQMAFDLYTEKAIKVVLLAEDEARQSGCRMSTGHILLGLIGEGTGVAAMVLKNAGFNFEAVRVEVGKIIGRGTAFAAVKTSPTSRAQRVLQLSAREARQLGVTLPTGNNYIGTEHLLLGLLSEIQIMREWRAKPRGRRRGRGFRSLIRGDEGVAGQVFRSLEVDIYKLRAEVILMTREYQDE